MTEFSIYQAAAFTAQPFGGNPAAVVPLSAWIDDGLMQKIAAENNLSETAFFVPAGPSEWEIRWFTPTVEVPLCGHATLASAAVIREKLGHEDWPVRLLSASGPLVVELEGDGYLLDLPANPPVRVEPPDGLAESLGLRECETWLGRDIYMVPLESQAAVEALAPKFERLAEVVAHGIVVTAPGDEVDFVSRFFAPAIGIDEDPVTGAAHCLLVPYWAQRTGKNDFEALQVSSRLGTLGCQNRGNRVRLKGNVVFFLSGRIIV